MSSDHTRLLASLISVFHCASLWPRRTHGSTSKTCRPPRRARTPPPRSHASFANRSLRCCLNYSTIRPSRAAPMRWICSQRTPRPATRPTSGRCEFGSIEIQTIVFSRIVPIQCTVFISDTHCFSLGAQSVPARAARGRRLSARGRRHRRAPPRLVAAARTDRGAATRRLSGTTLVAMRSVQSHQTRANHWCSMLCKERKAFCSGRHPTNVSHCCKICNHLFPPKKRIFSPPLFHAPLDC